MLKKFKTGDTLIEVMLAVSVFAAVMVGGITIMNNAVARTQSSLQLTMARNAIDSQAEALRYLNNSYLADPSENANEANLWLDIKNNRTKNSATSLNTCPSDQQQIRNIGNAFFLNVNDGITIRSGDSLRVTNNNFPFPSISDGRAYGIWIEAIRDIDVDNRNYIDFHVRACWKSSGSNVNTTLGTIVRLYDPNN